MSCDSDTQSVKNESPISTESRTDYDDFLEESTAGNATSKTTSSYLYSGPQSTVTVQASDAAACTFSDGKSNVGATKRKDKPSRKRKQIVPKVIYSGNIKFQVLNIHQATDSIKAICARYGATISKLNLASSHNQISNSIEVRIAQGSFNDILPLLKKQSVKMDAVNLKSRDVTAEFIDIESRLKTKKSARDRYIEVLRKKADKVRDIIEAEEVIRSITEEIEAKEGRLRYLKDKVRFSTITINIYEKIDTQEIEAYYKPFSEKIKEAAINGWNIITHLFLFLINIWPLLLLIGFLYWKRKWLKSKWG